jgi:hypothetical protein
MIDFRVAAEKLAGFETADEIAEFLKDYQIQATCEDGMKCALAMWLQQVTGEPGIMVSLHTTYYKAPFHEYYIELEKAEDVFDNTQAMIEFIEKFDMGEYPDLTRVGPTFRYL